ncbi:Gfo/Idh/MocA family oxidoreductase [candidate division KSB1 bacterium]|nr:Gfo/Idh/MocA family oxidoreductase [candidate division KSB1 bacterium]RQW04586.1 MAG: gfo/Idh/MocA family oxidoreductase [candidate division KSB1 bacterium]
MHKVKWGVLSTARIGVDKVIPALQKAEQCEVIAISSRDIGKARAAADRLGICRAYGSYEELLADPDVEAVYNPTPNHLHVPLSMQALRAGKHVLCEKPIALDATEAQQLLDEAKSHSQLKIMEAFMYRFHPQWRAAKKLVKNGDIGAVKTIQTIFTYNNLDPNNVRNKADIGGGGLMDIGCYPISLSRFILDAEPIRVNGIIEFDPTFRTDRLVSALLDFGAAISSFAVATQAERYQRVHIFGTRGRIEIEIPFNAPPTVPTRIWHEADGHLREIKFDICDQYAIQGDEFSSAILRHAPVPTPLQDAVANMKVIDALLASNRTGEWQAIS